MFDPELNGLVKISKSGESLNRAELYDAMKRIAARLAGSNESVEKAFTRIFATRGAEGIEVFKRYNAMRGQPDHFAPQPIVKAKAQTGRDGDVDDGDGDGKASFSGLVDDHMRKNPGTTRSKAIDAVAGTPKGSSALLTEKYRRRA